MTSCRTSSRRRWRRWRRSTTACRVRSCVNHCLPYLCKLAVQPVCHSVPKSGVFPWLANHAPRLHRVEASCRHKLVTLCRVTSLLHHVGLVVLLNGR